MFRSSWLLYLHQDVSCATPICMQTHPILHQSKDCCVDCQTEGLNGEVCGSEVKKGESTNPCTDGQNSGIVLS